MAQRKRTTRATDREITKTRQDFLLLECGRGEHKWNNAAAPGYKLCIVCKSLKRDDDEELFLVEKKLPKVKPDLMSRTNREIRKDDILNDAAKRGLKNYWG